MRICLVCSVAITGYKYCLDCGLQIRKEKQKTFQKKYKIVRQNKVRTCKDCGKVIGAKIKRCDECKKVSTSLRLSVYQKNARLENLELFKTRGKVQYEKLKANRDKYQKRIAASSRRYIKKIPTLTKEEKKHKQKMRINEYAKKYYPEYYKKKPSQKIAVRFRQRIWKLLKGIDMEYKIEDLIGCSKSFLQNYLEGLFLDGMTWDNWSPKGWHIDHKKPCISYDLTDIEELKKCFHYTNLQPLWAKDNLKKGGRFNG